MCPSVRKITVTQGRGNNESLGHLGMKQGTLRVIKSHSVRSICSCRARHYKHKRANTPLFTLMIPNTN